MQKTSLFNIVKPYLAISIAFMLTVTLAAGPYFVAEIAPHLLTALWLSLIFMILITIIQIA
ncbi:MAG: diguanylate phosphodiesterase, partial [Nitrosomonadaceae bacterium]|nr:diguanylate phosphodiesterase [Nitrosomonadaceae bacterium]